METRRTTFSGRTRDGIAAIRCRRAIAAAAMIAAAHWSAPRSAAQSDRSTVADATASVMGNADQSTSEDRPDDLKGASAATADNRRSDDQFVRVGVDDRITLHIARLPLGDATRMLSEPTKRNIILGPGASGEVSATLYDAHELIVAPTVIRRCSRRPVQKPDLADEVYD